MPKFEFSGEQEFTILVSKSIKLVANNSEEAQEKFKKLFSKFVNSLPFECEEASDLDVGGRELDEESEDAEFVYEQDNYNLFVADMKEAGLEVRHYDGRWAYSGPAVSCDNIDEVTSKTSVSCRSDNLGLGYIVYPR